MDKLKQYVIFTVLGCLVILAVGWSVLVSPKRSQAADLTAQAAAQVSSDVELSTKLVMLKAQAKDLPKQQAKLAAVAAKIPDNPALPALVRALTAASSAAGVELVSVAPGTPTAPTVTAATTGNVAAGGGATTAAAAAAAASAGGSTAGHLATIPVTLNIAGGYFQVEQFLHGLENLPRSMRITGVTLAPGPNPLKAPVAGAVDDGKSLTTTITGMVFMASNRAPATVAVVPAQPKPSVPPAAAGPAVAPGSSPSPSPTAGSAG